LQEPPKNAEADPSESGFLRRLNGRIQSGAIGGWLADWWQFWWALIALNLRKTLFVVRRGDVHCPCQNPSDSGKAWETGCDPAASWHSAARFRRVCPLLKKAPNGRWVCSANTADVRPFWGRAAAWIGGAAAVLYLACATLALVFLQSVGYPVRFVSVAWPPAWHDVTQARAEYFFHKAEAALRANRASEALLSLAQSYQLDPHNYAAGRILAQLWQTSEADVSNQIYRKLMAEHPEQRSQTAQAWYMSLLARGDFNAIESLAWDRLNADPSTTSAWLNVLMVASRRTGDTSYLKKAATARSLPDFGKLACAWELKTREAPPEAVRRLLTEPLPANTAPYLLYYRIDWLTGAGFASDALYELDREQNSIGPVDRIKLYLDAYASLGWQSILEDQADKVLVAYPHNAFILELICAHLIRYPNPGVLARVAAAFDKFPPEPADQRLGAYTSFFCAAGAAGDWKHLKAAEAILKTLAGGRYATLDAMEGYFRSESRNVTVERYLPALPSIPVEISCALYEYSDRQRPGKKPRPRRRSQVRAAALRR